MSTPYIESQRQDWQNRELTEVISRNIKKIADFLNHFDQSCRGRLAELNSKITNLERRVDFLDASITGAANNQMQRQQQQHQQPSPSQDYQSQVSYQDSIGVGSQGMQRLSNSTLGSQYRS